MANTFKVTSFKLKSEHCLTLNYEAKVNGKQYRSRAELLQETEWGASRILPGLGGFRLNNVWAHNELRVPMTDKASEYILAACIAAANSIPKGEMQRAFLDLTKREKEAASFECRRLQTELSLASDIEAMIEGNLVKMEERLKEEYPKQYAIYVYGEALGKVVARGISDES